MTPDRAPEVYIVSSTPDRFELVKDDGARSYATIVLSRAELEDVVRDGAVKLAATAEAHAKNLHERRREDERQAQLFTEAPTE